MAMAFGCWAQGRTVESYPWQPHFSGGEMQKHLCAVWCQHMLKNPRWSNLIWSPPLHCLTFSMCRYRTLNTRYHILIGGGEHETAHAVCFLQVININLDTHLYRTPTVSPAHSNSSILHWTSRVMYLHIATVHTVRLNLLVTVGCLCCCMCHYYPCLAMFLLLQTCVFIAV